MIRIIQFLPSIQDGGAETLVKDYALSLNRDYYDVKIVSIYNAKNVANYKILAANSVKMISIYKKWNKINRAFNKVFGKLYIPHRFLRIIRYEKPEVIHVHMEMLRYLIPISRHIKGIKLFYTCHSIPERYFAGKNCVEYKAAKKLINDNGLRLIALHNEMKMKLDSMFDINNTLVVRNGIDISRFKNVNETKEMIRESLGIPTNAFVVGNIGRFFDVKNHGFLIEIFTLIQKKETDAFLLLVGAGPLKEEIEDKINGLDLNSRVLILSHRSDIPRILKAMDVFVLPSKYEGIPVTLLEAQAAGLRCIVSDKINHECFICDTVVPLSIDDSPVIWCDTILNPTIKGKSNGSIEDFHIKSSIKVLEQLYQNN